MKQQQYVCHDRQPGRKLDFIVGLYQRDCTGEWQVPVPRRGPCSEYSRQLCCVGLHHLRERQTGPGHPLVVVRCTVHRRFFTIYPKGFVPYSRRRLPCDKEDIGADALDAVRDAADDHKDRWSADSDINAAGWASTQWRHIVRFGRWLGLSVPKLLQQRIATALTVPLCDHAAAAKCYLSGTYRKRATAILDVLRCLSAKDVMRFLLRAGRVAGLLGRSFSVDSRGRLRPISTSDGRNDSDIEGLARHGPPSTTWQHTGS